MLDLCGDTRSGFLHCFTPPCIPLQRGSLDFYAQASDLRVADALNSMRMDGRRVWHPYRRASALLALPLAGSALIHTRPWHGHIRCPKIARHVLSQRHQVLQVTDPDDLRVAIYKGRSVRNASAYDAQIRALAEDFLQTGSTSISAVFPRRCFGYGLRALAGCVGPV